MGAAEKEVVIAINGEKLRDYSEVDLQNSLLQLIAKTHISIGQKFDKDQSEMANLTVNELASDLKKHSGNLAFGEVELAFKNGYKGEYGEFFGLNNRTYFHWISAYSYCQNRMRVLAAIAEEKEKCNKPKELSEQEKEAIVRNGCIQEFTRFKNFGTCEDFGNVKYNYLDKLGLIPFSKERKANIMERVKSEMLRQKKIQYAEAKNSAIRNDIKKMIDKLEHNVTDTLKSEAKREALRIYFQELKEMDENLEDLINAAIIDFKTK